MPRRDLVTQLFRAEAESDSNSVRAKHLSLEDNISPKPGWRVFHLYFIALLVPILFLAVFLSIPTLPPVQAINAPTLLAPADGIKTSAISYTDYIAYPPLAIPVFQWTAVPSATQYLIQFSENQDFTSYFDYTTPLTTFIPTQVGKFSDRQWYWRVAVKQPTAGPFSPARSFTRKWSTENNLPILTTPADNATLEFFESPNFTWQPVIGAASYRFQIAASAGGFNAPLIDATTLAHSYQHIAKLENGIYYWRVVPVDPEKRDGTPSEVRSFNMAYNRVPALLEPVNNSTPEFTPTFRWKAVAGAQYYELHYSTDPTFNTNITKITTRNTAYTPVDPLPNDVNYYWRVRAISGASVSDWSNATSPLPYSFMKKWYIQPIHLTPTNNEKFVRFPFFSWTPVPGASYYKIEMTTSNDCQTKLEQKVLNPFYVPERYKDCPGFRFWRVTPYDTKDQAGKTSVEGQFSSSSLDSNPTLEYPLYYYPPRADLNPHEDRTAALPIFKWSRLFAPFGDIFPNAYRIQVCTIYDDCSNVVWTTDTENLSAAPTVSNPFTPTVNTDYYWRVCPLSNLGSACIRNDAPPPNNNELWSQIWRARFDLSLGITPRPVVTTTLLRPAHAEELVEATPLFEWKPLQDAEMYEIQISQDENFTNLVDSARTAYTAYSPLNSLGQRSINVLTFGTYYWRVRARIAGAWQVWSDTWRFQVAAQSQWIRYRSLGAPDNRLKIASAPQGDASSPFDLTTLFASQSADQWFFGFNANGSNTDLMYGLYLDINHQDNLGAASDPQQFDMLSIPAHHPEYAIYVKRDTTDPFSISPEKTFVYEWNDGAWGTPRLLSNIAGGDIFPTLLRSVTMGSDSSAWTVGQYGDILRWNGSGWTSYDSPTPQTLHAVAEEVAYAQRRAVGDGGTLLEWDYGLNRWQTLKGPTTANLYGFQIVSPTLSVAVGSNGTIIYWKTNNNQSNFEVQAVSPATYYSFNSVSMLVPGAPADGWAVGNSGTIARWVFETGSNRWLWKQNPIGTFNDLYGVVQLAANNAWIVGENDTLLHWDGSSWSASLHPQVTQLNAIAAVSEDDIWVVGDGGVILHWDGSAWSKVTSPTGLNLYGISMYSATNGLIIGERGVNLHWDGSTWSVIEDPIAHYIEIRLPNTAIGMSQDTGSVSAVLFSTSSAMGSKPADAVPYNPGIPGGNTFSRFASVSERLQLSVPFNASTGDPSTLPSTPPFFWEYPYGYPPSAPWAGVRMGVYLDQQFTTQIGVFDLKSDSPYYAPNFWSWLTDLRGDNTYYWRVRPRYLDVIGEYWGAWSQGTYSATIPSMGWSFERTGFVPKNLKESVTFATPTFSWDRVEGADKYEIAYDDDPNFTTPVVVKTNQVSYTPQEALKNGVYSWKVRVYRWGPDLIVNEWSSPKSFTLSLPPPEGLRPNDPNAQDVVQRAPTLCWDAVLKNQPGTDNPVLGAYRYQLQVSTDAAFSQSNLRFNVSTEQTCWTPHEGIRDGQYYWRVAMIDGSNNLSDYSATAVFTKQYPSPTLISPISGTITSTPTFKWSAVPGAALYHIEVAVDKDFTQIYDKADTNNTTYTPQKVYIPNRTYYWRVAIIDKNNNYGPYNNARLGPEVVKIHLPLTMRRP